MPRPLTFKEAKTRLRQKYPNLILKSFTTVIGSCVVRCTRHSVTHEYTCYNMVKGCPECGRESWRTNRKPKTQKQYKKEVREGTKGKILVLGDYVNANTKIKHFCIKCKTTLLVTPKSMLQNLACMNCSQSSGQGEGSKYKFKKLGSRLVRVQGGEPEALDFLVRSCRIKPKNIVVGSDCKIEAFYYKYNGRVCMYRPDFLIKSLNRIVEVKSTWYFGLTNKEYYERLRLKAKAVVDSGYDFRVIICSLKYSKPILLPENWFILSHKKFQKYWVDTYGLTLHGCLARC